MNFVNTGQGHLHHWKFQESHKYSSQQTEPDKKDLPFYSITSVLQEMLRHAGQWAETALTKAMSQEIPSESTYLLLCGHVGICFRALPWLSFRNVENATEAHWDEISRLKRTKGRYISSRCWKTKSNRCFVADADNLCEGNNRQRWHHMRKIKEKIWRKSAKNNAAKKANEYKKHESVSLNAKLRPNADNDRSCHKRWPLGLFEINSPCPIRAANPTGRVLTLQWLGQLNDSAGNAVECVRTWNTAQSAILFHLALVCASFIFRGLDL